MRSCILVSPNLFYFVKLFAWRITRKGDEIMECKNAIVAGKMEAQRASESDVVDVIVFDKDAMHRDLMNGLKDFGIGCCEVGKVTLAPLVSTMLKHFFNWVIDSVLK